MSFHTPRRSLTYLTAAVTIGLASISAAQPPRAAGDPLVENAPAAPRAEREPGYLGLITDDRREQGQGVRVVRVVENTPAEKAGFQVNDLIVAIDGQPTGSLNEMAALLEPHTPQNKVRFEVLRSGTTETLEVTLGRRPSSGQRPFDFGRIPERLPEPDRASPPQVPLAPDVTGAAAMGGQLLGIRTSAVSEEFRQRLRLPTTAGARVVSRVVGSPADQARIPLDSVIVAVDGQPAASPADLARLIAAAGPGKQVELTYFSDGQKRQSLVTLAEVSRPPLPDEAELSNARVSPPLPQAAPSTSAAARIELLERRIRELELRVQQLERAARG